MEAQLSIIIPVFNEGDNISSTIEEIGNKVKTPNHIYIIYDSADDNTLPVAMEIAKTKNNLHMLRNK